MYCEEGWTVVQRRKDGSENFKRAWLDYREGFGDLTGEFWLGNEKLYLLSEVPSVLLVELTINNTEELFAVYNLFQVRMSTGGNYQLIVDNYHGTAGDALSVLNGALFSTSDKDNDDENSNNCADDLDSAWWYKKCLLQATISADLNGVYSSGIRWLDWPKVGVITSVTMKIKPKQGKKLR